MATSLTTNEQTLLKSYEGVIGKGIAAFQEVGAALLHIRDGRLYRAEFKTFEEYCRAKWNMDRHYAHRLTTAAETIEMLPVGNKPNSERQARPLTSVPKESRAEVWQHAVDTAPRDEDEQPVITARHVEKAVKEWKEEKKPKPEKAQGPSLPDTSAFDDLAESIKALVADASALSKSDAGKFLNIKRVRALASDIRKLLKEARPVAICPYCEGRRCQMCARSGAVTEEMVSNFEPEGK